MKHKTPLTGKVALVTGGGRGIGRETALAMAQAGAFVAVAARSKVEIDQVAQEIEARHGTSLSCPVDVSDVESVERMMDLVWQEWGSVDILVNNAGVIEPIGMAWKVEAQEWIRAITVNLGGVYLCSRAFVQRLLRDKELERRSAKIINVSTGAAQRVQPGCSAYCASKAGIDHFTRVLAAELEGHGISVNTVYPGMVDTQMMERLRSADPERFPESDRFNAMYTQGGLRHPSEVAQLITWLASPLADDLNGEIVRLDDETILRRMSRDLSGKRSSPD